MKLAPEDFKILAKNRHVFAPAAERHSTEEKLFRTPNRHQVRVQQRQERFYTLDETRFIREATKDGWEDP